MMPDLRLAAPWIMDWMASAPCLPIMPPIWSTMAPRAASAPNTRPAMAITMTSTGAIEVMV